MSPVILMIVVGGAAAGVGIWMLVMSLAPERPDLADALTRNRKPAQQTWISQQSKEDSKGLRGLQTVIEVRLAKLPLATPNADLDVIETSRGAFLLLRVGVALVGLLVAPIYTVIFGVFGTSIPPAIPAGLGVAAAVLGWIIVGLLVHSRAEDRRREMRYALVSFFTLAALHRASGQAMHSSMVLAAGSSPAWTFRRIGRRLSASSRTSQQDWDGLQRLAVEMSIEELADLASIADVASSQGAGVYSTLLARAESLRHELQTQEEAVAAIAASRMVFPKVLLGMATFAFLLYPVITRISGS